MGKKGQAVVLIEAALALASGAASQAAGTPAECLGQ